NHCLSLRSNDSTKNLSLIKKDFGNVNDTYIPTTITSDNWTTFTITGNGSFITLYQDGISIGTLDYVAEDKNITGIQFGCSIAGGNNRPITSAKIDNVGLWNTALTADQVKSLNGLVPEPTTVSLSLVGLAALMLRRRRA
ncbi:MAG: LamG-like jellyroll fold domain-containing protein, partial [Akkermansia sp.]